VKRIAIVARLRPGAHERAKEILSEGPPFDPERWGVERHTVCVSQTEVVFVFEGDEVEWRVDDLVGDFLTAGLKQAFDQWRRLVDGRPKLAEQVYFWEAPSP
jgi:hypothetical protein